MKTTYQSDKINRFSINWDEQLEQTTEHLPGSKATNQNTETSEEAKQPPETVTNALIKQTGRVLSYNNRK